MKLKKFAALVLAGVMAVSMLAGCGGEKNDGPDQSGATTSTTTAGYSAAFADIADVDLDYVTFQDSAADQAALKESLKTFTDVQLYTALVGGNTWPGSRFPTAGLLSGAMSITNYKSNPKWNFFSTFIEDFTAEADLDEYIETLLDGDGTGNPFNLKNYIPFSFVDDNMTGTVKKGAVIAVDGTMSPEAAMMLVDKLVEGLSDLNESGTVNGITVDYHYTVSVSMASRTTAISDVLTADMDYVAVTVTRTGTAHQA